MKILLACASTLIAYSTTVAQVTVVSDVGTASEWFTTYSGATIDVTNSGTPAIITVDSGTINYRSADYTNNTASNWNGVDFQGLYRAFTATTLAVGESMTATFTLIIPNSLGNTAYSTSTTALSVGFLNKGNSETIPAAGTVNEMTAGSDYLLTDADSTLRKSATAFHIGMQTGGGAISAYANGITNSGSDRLIISSSGMVISPTGTISLGANIDYTQPLTLTLTYESNGIINGGAPIYSLALTVQLVEGAGSATTTYTIGDKANYYVGGGDWTHFFVAKTGGTQIGPTQTGYDDFSVADLVITKSSGGATPFEVWRDGIDWGSKDSSASADVEPDGIPNILEFAFNSDPLVSDNSIAGPTASFVEDSGTRYLVLSHRRNLDATDLNFGYKTSSDLELWSGYTPEPADISTTSVDSNTDKVDVRVPVPSGNPVFLQLEVTQ